MAQEVFEIFTHMHVVGVIFLVIAMVLFILELVLAGFGACGIASCFCFIVAFVVRFIQGATTLQAIVMIVVMVVAVVSVAMFTIKSKREGTFYNSLINKDTSIPEDYSDPEGVYGYLVGQEGELLTQCKPVGKARIDDATYVVYATSGYITRGATVKVTSVEGDNIFVERV